MNIIISGSTVFDRIMNFPGAFSDHIIAEEIHKLNVSFVVKEFKETYGGAAANIAYSLSLLNEYPILHSAVGYDFNVYNERLTKLKINLAGIKKYDKIATASAYIMTDKNDNQITGFFPGAMIFYSQKPKVQKGDLAIISPGNANEMLDLADSYSKKNIPFIFDPGQQIIQFTKSQLKKAISQSTIYIVNDYELSLTQKIISRDRNTVLKSAGILITTLGSKGSTIEMQQGNKVEQVKIMPVKTNQAIDPTGAGDSYRAGLIKGLVNYKVNLLKDNPFKVSWLKIGQMGSLSSMYAVEKYGTQNHHYSYKQFKEKYLKEFGVKL